ncbi:MAG TPA: ATP-binding protein [Bacteroidia bacterium]|nr:ATP-binding protein [Bacteroidia bacterium]
MKSSLTYKVVLGFLLVAGTLSFASFFMFRELRRISSSINDIGPPDRRIMLWKSVLDQLDRAGTCAESWKISSDPAVLDELDSCRTFIGDSLAQLRRLNAKFPEAHALADSLTLLSDAWDEYLGDRIALSDTNLPGQLVADNVLREMAMHEMQASRSDMNFDTTTVQDTLHPGKKQNFWQRVFGKRQTVQAQDVPAKDTAAHVSLIETSRVRNAIVKGQNQENLQENTRLRREMALLKTGISLQERLRHVTSRYEKIIGREEKEKFDAATRTSVEGTMSIIFWIAGVALCLMLLFVYLIRRDIIRNRKLQAELDTARRNAEMLARTKEEFMANMSHEIRTPLNIISGFSEQLLKSPLNDLQRIQAESIQRSSDHLLGIVNDLLDYSKMQSGKFEFEEIGFSTSDLTGDLRSAFSGNATQKGLSFSVSCSSDVPEVLIGDPVRIRQVLYNLISNSVKFTERGKIDVALAKQKDLVDNTEWLRATVSDTGVGISNEKIEAIFEAFTQADNSITRRFGGTGLGLSITRFLVEKMNGTIHVESTEGKGTVFTVLIPMRRGSPKDIPGNTQKAMPGNFLGGKTILVCDDEPVNRLLAGHILSAHGAQVLEAGGGKEALSILDQTKTDVVLMDLQMPQMNGNEATQLIRSSENASIASVRIIAVTGRANPGEKEHCMENGMDGYVNKPYKEEQLLSEIARVLGKIPA